MTLSVFPLGLGHATTAELGDLELRGLQARITGGVEAKGLLVELDALLQPGVPGLQVLNRALERGYAVARTADGRILHDATTLSAGDPLQVIVSRGAVDTRVEQTRQDGTKELLG